MLTIYLFTFIVEKEILVVRGYNCQYSYYWNKYDPYGIGPVAPISPKLIHQLSSLFSIIVGYYGYKFNNLISLIFVQMYYSNRKLNNLICIDNLVFCI